MRNIDALSTSSATGYTEARCGTLRNSAVILTAWRTGMASTEIWAAQDVTASEHISMKVEVQN